MWLVIPVFRLWSSFGYRLCLLRYAPTQVFAACSLFLWKYKWIRSGIPVSIELKRADFTLSRAAYSSCMSADAVCDPASPGAEKVSIFTSICIHLVCLKNWFCSVHKLLMISIVIYCVGLKGTKRILWLTHDICFEVLNASTISALTASASLMAHSIPMALVMFLMFLYLTFQGTSWKDGIYGARFLISAARDLRNVNLGWDLSIHPTMQLCPVSRVEGFRKQLFLWSHDMISRLSL